MNKARFLLLISLLLLTLTGCSISRAMRVENREVIDVKTMMTELKDAPLVLVGESHDVPAHHEIQLAIVKSKKDAGQPVAIGMEMFELSSQKTLDEWSAGKLSERAFSLIYERNWRNLPYVLYRDIFLYARDNRIPIVALNAPRELVQQVARQGFESLTENDLKRLPEGVNAEVSDSYLEFIKAAYTGHGRNGSSFRFMCEAQMLRNRVMARRIGDYLLQHPDTSMVVIAGGGHARGNGGIPAELGNLPYKIVLPPITTLTSATVTKKDGDYLLEEPFFWLGEMF